MIYYSVPWSTRMRLGEYYNSFMSALPSDDDYACFIDGDATFTTTNYGRLIESVVRKYPGQGIFIGRTNRVGCEWQVVEGVNTVSNDVAYHRAIGKKLSEKYWDSCIPISPNPDFLMSGVLFVVKKSLWKKAGGFVESGILGVDNDFHRKCIKLKESIMLMMGMYVYHWYRNNNRLERSHLLKPKTAVYTCITGDYDEIRQPKVVTPGWTYVLFTDKKLGKKKVGVWDVREIKLEGSARKTARGVKILSHEYMRDYDLTVWVDGSIEINCDFNDLLARFWDGSTLLGAWKHPERDCIYQEAEACKRLGKDDPQVLDRQVAKLRRENYPANNGLVDTAFLIRDQREPSVRMFCGEWWNIVRRESIRDQMSFNYVAWKRRFRYKEIDRSLTQQWLIKRKHEKNDSRPVQGSSLPVSLNPVEAVESAPSPVEAVESVPLNELNFPLNMKPKEKALLSVASTTPVVDETRKNGKYAVMVNGKVKAVVEGRCPPPQAGQTVLEIQSKKPVVQPLGCLLVEDKLVRPQGLLKGNRLTKVGTAEVRQIVWCYHDFHFGNSLSQVSRATVQAFRENRIPIKTFGGKFKNIPVATQKELRESAVIVMDRVPPSKERMEELSDAPFLGGYYMLEGTKIREWELGRLEGYDVIFTPSLFCKTALENSGLATPVRIWGHGIDPGVFPYVEPKEGRPFTFLWFGDENRRKGYDLFLEAFSKVSMPNVRAWVRGPGSGWINGIRKKYEKDARIVWDTRVTPPEQLKAMMSEVDVIVCPLRGEGFNMPMLEAMASGKPAICTRWSGPLDFGGTTTYWIEVKGHEAAQNDGGVQVVPDMDQLVETMEYCAKHPNEVAERGLRASREVHAHWTWNQKVMEALPVLKSMIPRLSL